MRPLIALFAALVAAEPAHAGDSWSNVKPGIDYLKRTFTDDDGDAQTVYAVRVDLTVPNVGLHASSNTSGVERKVGTDDFADNADVVAAINGDWSDGNTPVGLAIADGSKWHSHIADDTLGSTWGFLACTATKVCTIDREKPLDEAWWFSTPTLPPYRYFQAVGMNSEKLVTAGAAERGCYDTSDTNPRSAACLDVTGTQLWLVVVDGRQSSSGAHGMTCDETRELLIDLGCWEGGMLDGGGSSTLVVNGRVKNSPSDGSPRTVANHFGIIYSDTIDARCTVANGRWCDGTTLSTCQGGRYLGSGDCGVYGATCEEDGDWAYCVDYRCPSGSGQGIACLDGTRTAYCSDGTYAEGDCGVYGLACGSDWSGSACMDSRCAAGPNSAYCIDGARYGACSAGAYAEGDCSASGLSCWGDGASVACIDGRCPSGPEGETCSGNVLLGCDGGGYHETDCAASGLVCDASLGCVPPGSDSGGADTDTSVAGPRDTGPPGMPGDRVAMSEAGRFVCASTSGAVGVVWALVAALTAVGARRGR
jgi:hypothetical protein